MRHHEGGLLWDEGSSAEDVAEGGWLVATCFSCCSILARPVSCQVDEHHDGIPIAKRARTVQLLRRSLSLDLLHCPPLVDRLLCIVKAHARRGNETAPAQHLLQQRYP